MTSPPEPRELFPFVLFAGRPSMAAVAKDFRAQPVSVDDAMPPRPVVAEVEPDPKSISSVTVSVTPSEPDSFVTPIPTQTITPTGSITPPEGEGNLVSVEKVTQPERPRL